MWLSLVDTTSISFQVRSCDAITVSLARYLGNHLSGYVVILGERDNTLSAIVRMSDGVRIAEVSLQLKNRMVSNAVQALSAHASAFNGHNLQITVV